MSISHRLRCNKHDLPLKREYAERRNYTDTFFVIPLTRGQRCLSDFFLTMGRDEGEEREQTIIRIASHWVRREVTSYDEAIEIIMKGWYEMWGSEVKFLSEGAIDVFERKDQHIFEGRNYEVVPAEIKY
jgi:hypothetical protein